MVELSERLGDGVHIGVDTDRTFTDFICYKAGEPAFILKLPSTPDDPSRAVLEGLRQILAKADATLVAVVVDRVGMASL